MMLLENAGDRVGEAAALFHLANLDMDKGDYQLAKEEFQKVLLHKRETGERSGEAMVLHSLGLVESQAGSKETAGENFKEALRIYQELADKPGEAGAFFQLGALCRLFTDKSLLLEKKTFQAGYPCLELCFSCAFAFLLNCRLLQAIRGLLEKLRSALQGCKCYGAPRQIFQRCCQN